MLQKFFIKTKLLKKLLFQFILYIFIYLKQNIKKEIEVLYLLKGHENILEIFEIFEEIDCFIIITELLEGGDLY